MNSYSNRNTMLNQSSMLTELHRVSSLRVYWPMPMQYARIHLHVHLVRINAKVYRRSRSIKILFIFHFWVTNTRQPQLPDRLCLYLSSRCLLYFVIHNSQWPLVYAAQTQTHKHSNVFRCGFHSHFKASCRECGIAFVLCLRFAAFKSVRERGGDGDRLHSRIVEYQNGESSSEIKI